MFDAAFVIDKVYKSIARSYFFWLPSSYGIIGNKNLNTT